jgi:hypothetical protein
MFSSTISLFRGWTAMEVDEILMPDELWSAHDEQGRQYVIARTEDATFLCAPITERALECVVSGRAELRAVFAHSSTGMVERLRPRNAGGFEESLIPCAELSDDMLPPAGVRLRWHARCA